MPALPPSFGLLPVSEEDVDAVDGGQARNEARKVVTQEWLSARETDFFDALPDEEPGESLDFFEIQDLRARCRGVAIPV